jgi:hypothetical protein
LLVLAGIELLDFKSLDLRRSWKFYAGGAATFIAIVIGMHLLAALISLNYFGMQPDYSVIHTLNALKPNAYWVIQYLAIALGWLRQDFGAISLLPIPFRGGSLFVGSALLTLSAGFMLSIFTPLRTLRLPIYLVLSCILTVAFDVAHDHWRDVQMIRYYLVTAFFPSAFAASVFASQKKRWILITASACCALISVSNSFDSVNYLFRLETLQSSDSKQEIADFLVRHRFQYGIAPYWTAYDVSFRTQGRVHLASSEFVRIPEFQDEYERHVREAVRIGGGPCPPLATVAVGPASLCVPQ